MFINSRNPVYPVTVQVGDKTTVSKEPTVPVAAGPGEVFSLSIPEKRVSGYKWQISAPEHQLQILGDDFKLPEGSQGHVDQIGTHTYKLEVEPDAPRKVSFDLVLRHSWETSGPGVDQKTIVVSKDSVGEQVPESLGGGLGFLL